MSSAESLHKGACHCGAVTFEISGPITKGAVCDCTLCKRKGTTMVPVEPHQIHITSGHNHISLYQYNTKKAKHYFCKICGIYTHHKRRRDENYCFNLGCVDSLSRDDLEEVMSIKGSAFSVEGEHS